ncbi:acyl-CoA dehydrogenase family protein [Nocardia sp. NPDC052566]|uniref:acyl-CoA dehydrogenase family protein n=1 Tax=Nocardia sp. NPDC052566 TaxID=3364330 RepID=UPI0037C5BF60
MSSESTQDRVLRESDRSDLDSVVGVLAEHAAEVDRAARFPAESMDALRRAGYLGYLVPVAYGGMGGDLAGLVRTAKALAGGCLSTAMIWAMHCQQVEVLVRHANPRLLGDVLPRIADGELYLASVTTGETSGGRLLSVDDPLRTAGTEVLLSRSAPVVTGGMHADAFLITMRASAEAGRHSVSLVYAERSALTIEPVGAWNTLGMRGTESGALRLIGTVRADDVIGEPGRFRIIATETMIPVGHIGWSACWLGAAHAAFRQLIGMLSRDSSRDLSSTLLRERIARIRFELELVGTYLDRVRESVDEVWAGGQTLDVPRRQIHLNTLKLAASELTFRAVDRMIQLAGLAAGYSADSPLRLERTFRDLRSAALNYSNDQLWSANGALALLDRNVGLL